MTPVIYASAAKDDLEEIFAYLEQQDDEHKHLVEKFERDYELALDRVMRSPRLCPIKWKRLERRPLRWR